MRKGSHVCCDMVREEHLEPNDWPGGDQEGHREDYVGEVPDELSILVR